MKLHPAISAKLAGLQPNHVGLLPWSLLAHPLPMQAGACPISLTPIPRGPQSLARGHPWSRASRPCRMSRRQHLSPERRYSGQTRPAPARYTRLVPDGAIFQPPVNSPNAGSRLT